MSIRAQSRRPVELAPRAADALLGVAFTAALGLIIALGSGNRPADPVAYLFAAGFGALLPARRRHPLVVVFAAVAGIFGYYTLEYPPIGVAVPLLGALFAAADAGLLWWAIGAATVVSGVALWFRIHEGEATGYLVGYEGVSNLALIVTAIAVGALVRSRRLHGIQQAEIDRLTREQAERRTELRLRAEREGLSRDLHDTVGHLMAVISVQAGVAAEAIGHDDDTARAAVGHIQDTSRRSLRDVRAMVRVLRADPTGDHRHVLSLADIPELARDAGTAGVEVSVETATALGHTLPPQVETTAYRIVQESLTNIVRHAQATEAQVCATIENGVLIVDIVDNGAAPGASQPDSAGHGLDGMRERVRLLGGTLTAGPRPESGFAVRAHIPIGAAE